VWVRYITFKTIPALTPRNAYFRKKSKLGEFTANINQIFRAEFNHLPCTAL